MKLLFLTLIHLRPAEQILFRLRQIKATPL